MFCRYFWCLICFLALLPLSGGEFATILNKEKNVEEGYTYSSKYIQAAFLNAALHSARITAGDFRIMPRSDSDNRHTLDEKEAKVRLFCKPDVRAKTAVKRSSRIHADEPWKITKLKDGLHYTRSYQKESHKLSANIKVRMPEDKSHILFEAEIRNTGDRICKAEFSCEFSFLRTEVEPLQLTLQREFMRYVNGQRTVFLCNEKTLLDGKIQTYWWRRVVRDANYFSNYFNRECIPFGHQRLKAPQYFGFTGLIGDGALIWELDKSTKLTELDISWDGERSDATPMWAVELAPKETVKIAFRVLAVRGIGQFDAVDGDWVFGYSANGELLKISSVPIRPFDRLGLNATISDQQSLVLISQRSELPAMSPFAPGRVEMRAAAAFQPNMGYPARLQLNSISDNKLITEVTSNIVP